MTSLRDIFKKSASKSKDVSKSINKGTNKVLDFDLSRLDFLFNWIFVVFFSLWAWGYFLHVFESYTFMPFGTCCGGSPSGKGYPEIHISSIISLHYVFKIYFIYFLLVALLYWIIAIKNKTKDSDVNSKQIIGFFLLNTFVTILSHYSLYFYYGYTLQEAFKYGL